MSDEKNVDEPVEPVDPVGDTSSDEEPTTAAEPSESSESTSARRTGNSAAAAASRARRIGGRPVTSGAAEPSAATGKQSAKQSDMQSDAGGKRFGAGRKRTSDSAEVTSAAKVAATGSVGPAKTSLSKSSSDNKRSQPVKDASSSPAPGRVVWVPAAVLSVLVVAMAVFFAAARLGGDGNSSSGSTTRDKVLAAAKSCLVQSNTYSYKDLGAFKKKGLACGTGTFATQFTNSVDKVLEKNAAAVKQTQAFQVNYAGIIDVTAKNEWDVMIYGQVNVTNVSTGKTGRIDPYGAIARMVLVKGTWRMSNLGTLCSTTVLAGGNKCT